MNETGDGWGDMNTWPMPELEDGDIGGWVWGEVDVEASPWVPQVEPPFFTIDQIQAASLEDTTPGMASYMGTIGIGALAFIAIVAVLLIVYVMRRRAY